MFKTFGGAFKTLLGKLLTSKKFLATVAGVLVALGSKIGLDLPTEATLSIVGAIAAYVIGQGIADNGKEAAKVAAESEERLYGNSED